MPAPRAREEQAARGLVDDLGRHPLALAVAAAGLGAEAGVRSFAEYRAAVANPTHDELEVAAAFTGTLPSGHESSIASTLNRTIRLLDDAAMDFLRLASVLAAQPIPAGLVIDVFGRLPAIDVAPRRPRRLGWSRRATPALRLGRDAARMRAVRAMHDAIRLSLANAAGESRSVHTIVSRVVRFRERDPERAAAVSHAAIEALTISLRATAHGRVSADPAMTLRKRQESRTEAENARHGRSRAGQEGGAVATS